MKPLQGKWYRESDSLELMFKGNRPVYVEIDDSGPRAGIKDRFFDIIFLRTEEWTAKSRWYYPDEEIFEEVSCKLSLQSNSRLIETCTDGADDYEEVRVWLRYPTNAGWYSFDGDTSVDKQLRRYAPDLKRLNVSGDFNNLCASINRSCTRVVDWEGKRQSCDANAGDTSRAAYCR